MRFATAAFLLIALAAGAVAGEVLADDWHAIHIGDARSGYSHSRTERIGEINGLSGQTVFITTTETVLIVARMGGPVTLKFHDRIVESASGLVLSFRRHQDLGGGPSLVTGALLPPSPELTPDRPWRMSVVNQGRESRIDYPAGSIGPAALARLARKAGLTEGAVVEATEFSLEALGRALVTKTTVGKREEIDLFGVRKSATRTTSRSSLFPSLETTTWVGDDGRKLRVEQPIPGMGLMRMSLTVEKIAKLPGEPAEMFLTTLIRPDRPIPEPRKGGRAVYRLRGSKSALERIPTGVGQTVAPAEGGAVLVTVDTTEEAPKSPITLPYPREKAGGLLDPSPLVESDDPTVVRFAREAVGETKDPVAAGRAIETFVRKRISNKSLDIAFASAAETAKSLEGDCSEHAVLGAAMARAVGLPSRVVLGLVYLSPGSEIGGKTGIFGYHMWFEVMIGEDAWMPLDAAIGTMDRTHIVLGRTDLRDVNPLIDLALPMLDLIGSLKIEVIETE